MTYDNSEKNPDLTGQTFNLLTIIKELGVVGRRSLVKCLCECGREVIRYKTYVTRSKIQSCGCLKGKHQGIHDMTNTSEFKTWCRMKSRCYNENNPSYKFYGERGIIVCDRWMESFLNFFQDMGVKPSPLHSLDRIKVNGNYEKSNCRWATNKEQGNNRRDNVLFTIHNVTKTKSQWADQYNMNQYTLDSRLRRGIPIEEALIKPVMYKNKKTA